ncbi:prepilin-type N-terminal cleavage/methylation domain-containing protein [Deinococcus misasensis]|uniref:prepilin-type N-terminal cleavage/methylation domain-containing protein n=1 Tax=Deinococcus misasensis TaxID=392413 RepID=UPI0005591A37|nr:prepilin-type N-terminal cleavage/methylation domain-containing protein [Deinococcus misasensis]
MLNVRLSSQKGLTLIEVLMGLMVLALLVLCVVPLQTGSLQASGKASMVQKASFWLDQTLAGLHLQDFEGLTARCRNQTRDGFELQCTLEPCGVQRMSLQCPGPDLAAYRVSVKVKKQNHVLASAQTVIAR